MKLSTLLLLLILAALGYVAWTGRLPQEESSAEPSRSAAANAPGSAAARATTVRVTRGQLVTISGRVASVKDGAVTINCPPPALPPRPDFSGPIWQVGPYAGNQASKNIARIAAQQEAEYQAAVDAAARQVSGIVLVHGHPQVRTLRPGMPLQITAAPLGGRNFTMAYEIAPDPPGSWMFQGGGALDRPAH